MDEDVPKTDTESLLGDYTAFQKWEYDKIFYEESSPKSWLDIGESFYRASLLLVKGVAEDDLNEDTEGIAGALVSRSIH